MIKENFQNTGEEKQQNSLRATETVVLPMRHVVRKKYEEGWDEDGEDAILTIDSFSFEKKTKLTVSPLVL